jgi:hypothetical protein
MMALPSGEEKENMALVAPINNKNMDNSKAAEKRYKFGFDKIFG